MFQKTDIDALLDGLAHQWKGKPEYEQLVRDAHLAMALSDAGRPLDSDVDPRVAALIEEHRPRK